MAKSKKKKGILELGAALEAAAEQIDPDKEAVSKFEKKFKTLSAQLRTDDDIPVEALNRDMLRVMLSMVLHLIPIAERLFKTKRSESTAYALNALLNQARELSLDLKLAKDITSQAEFIKTSLLLPVFTSFTQLLIQEIFALKNTIDTEVSPKQGKALKKQVDTMARTLGTFQTEMLNKISDDIDSFLTGTLHTKQSTHVKNKSGRKAKHNGTA